MNFGGKISPSKSSEINTDHYASIMSTWYEMEKNFSHEHNI